MPLDYPSNNIGNGPGLLTAATGGQIERSGSPETCYSSMRSTSMESVQETHETDIESGNLKQDLDPSETQGRNELTDVTIDEVKVICIFDGLDECRFSLDFLNHPSLADINQPASVDILITNIIKGDLLSHSPLWITSRPAATNQLPPEYVQRVTEIRGFNDAQKEEYFRRRIQDQAQAERVIKQIKSSRSLHIMCYMPVFCCMSASVVQTMSCEPEGDESPKTLPQMFTHFLLIELKLKREKDQAKNLTQTESDQDILVKLGKLAFKNLEEGQLVFYKGELTDCGSTLKHTMDSLCRCSSESLVSLKKRSTALFT
ncbi:hypothetical protein AALO_G00266570 [Alosa alosa]|uniref:Uncharacterized protein n=1 Tax=Alosa alosa TaxID=278164 RepID=A0AAV6FL36_9TELE|nr:hypothetical protein AALO_G00266570 [Alosa alosa]